MSRPNNTGVFISYARKDRVQLAQRLQRDLSAQDFDAWLDTQRLAGGATWTSEIEHAIDASCVLLALMTPGSYVSEISRAEQLRSLRGSKRVIIGIAGPGDARRLRPMAVMTHPDVPARDAPAFGLVSRLPKLPAGGNR